MKKTIALTLAAAAVAGLFASCSEKEGVYNPSKKISHIYESSVNIDSHRDSESGIWYHDTVSCPKSLAEDWTWDGDKLTKITIYEVANVNHKSDIADVINFSYDGKQMTRAEGEDQIMTVEYDGKQLKQAKLFEKDSATTQLIATITFERTDNRVTKLNITGDMLDFMGKGRNLTKVLFRSVLPTVGHADRAVAALAKAADRAAGSKAAMTITFNLTWTGDNVSAISANFSGMTMNGKFTFDNKHNPYQKFPFSLTGVADNIGTDFFNQNNTTKSELTVSMPLFGTQTDVETFVYTYSGDWPLTQTATSDNGNEDDGYRNQSTTTRYFEYR